MPKDRSDSGRAEDKKVECPVCEGKKEIKYWRRASDKDPHWVTRDCPKCKGTGKIDPGMKRVPNHPKEKCPVCNGHGKIMIVRDDNESEWKQKECPECDGTGKV
jgi:DnaJ-class molecular chaperone